ncbi:MAG: hypothetical protein ACKO2P_08040 [Planctomycetota bacterium]
MIRRFPEIQTQRQHNRDVRTDVSRVEEDSVSAETPRWWHTGVATE